MDADNDNVELLLRHYLLVNYNCSCFEESCQESTVHAKYRDRLCGGTPATPTASANMTDVYLRPLPISETGQSLLIVAYGIAIILSLLGNMTVILVLSRSKRTRSNLNILLINLAVSDIAMAAFCMPFTFISIMWQQWTFGDFMCPFVHFMQQVSVLVSIFTLVVISVDRWRAVENPLRVRTRSPSYRKMATVVGVWLLAINTSVIQLIITRTFTTEIADNVTITICHEDWSGSPSAPIAYEIFFSVFFFVIPLVILCGLYGRIVNRLWTRNVPHEDGGSRYKMYEQQLQMKWKVVRMVLLVVSVFFLCWLPLHILRLVVMANPLIMYKEDNAIIIVKIYFAVHFLAMANSFFNPVIYTFLDEKFRAGLKQVLSCSIKKNLSRQKHRSFTSKSEYTRTSSIRVISIV